MSAANDRVRLLIPGNGMRNTEYRIHRTTPLFHQPRDRGCINVREAVFSVFCPADGDFTLYIVQLSVFVKVK